MGKLLQRCSLYLVAVLALAVGVYTLVQWSSLPLLSRMVGLFFVGIVAHVWEENRFPGGFSEMITEHLRFTAKSKDFGEAVTMTLILFVVGIPLLLPDVAFLQLAPMFLGVLEAVMHTALIPLLKLGRPYSPGLVTAVLVLLPISLYSMIHAVSQHLVRPLDWLWALLYMAVGLILAQRFVVNASGMSYRKFLRNARAAISAR